MQRVTGSAADGDGAAHRFEFLIARQERMCRELEALADTLPDRTDTWAAITLAASVAPTLRLCHDFEEARVLPAVLAVRPELEQTVARLRAEHLEDEDHAHALREAVDSFVRDPLRAEAHALGYQLRGLFRPLRRHTAFDRDVILPLFRRTLRP